MYSRILSTHLPRSEGTVILSILFLLCFCFYETYGHSQSNFTETIIPLYSGEINSDNAILPTKQKESVCPQEIPREDENIFYVSIQIFIVVAICVYLQMTQNSKESEIDNLKKSNEELQSEVNIFKIASQEIYTGKKSAKLEVQTLWMQRENESINMIKAEHDIEVCVSGYTVVFCLFLM